MIMGNPRVLIVDDEPIICDLVSEDLNELGYLCEVALDANCALQKMANEEFDVTLLDIRLPEISGLELLKDISSKYNSVVIMITAIDDVNTAVESMKLGALDYIVKPFSLDMLNARINEALKKNSRSVIKANSYEVHNIVSEEREIKEIDAIANGVEVQLDLTDKRSSTVTRKTIQIARTLGIPDERIRQWVIKRVTNNKNYLKVLKKFNQNAIAQVQMGVTEEYRLKSNPYKLDN